MLNYIIYLLYTGLKLIEKAIATPNSSGWQQTDENHSQHRVALGKFDWQNAKSEDLAFNNIYCSFMSALKTETTGGAFGSGSWIKVDQIKAIPTGLSLSLYFFVFLSNFYTFPHCLHDSFWLSVLPQSVQDGGLANSHVGLCRQFGSGPFHVGDDRSATRQNPERPTQNFPEHRI